MKHEPTVCGRDFDSLRYHGRGWSAAFDCPQCGRSGRFHLNYLGQRQVVCNGEKFTKEKKS